MEQPSGKKYNQVKKEENRVGKFSVTIAGQTVYGVTESDLADIITEAHKALGNL